MAGPNEQARADHFVTLARAACERRDGVSVRSYCSAALQLVPGHEPAAALLAAANPHGWSCQCKPCQRGQLPDPGIGTPVEGVPQGDGKGK